MLPLRLKVSEFAALVRLHPETVREKIRARLIEAQGRPHMIPRRELEKFGITIAEADFVFSQAMHRHSDSDTVHNIWGGTKTFPL
jgi:hypothetical protein